MVNSYLGRFAAAPSLEHFFLLTYEVILQSSLTTVISLTSGYSSYLRVSVLGTGRTRLTLATFLGNRRLLFLTRLATFIPHVFVLMIPVLNKESTPTLCPPLPIGGEHSRFRHCITACSGAGISTCCPSTTPVGLALGPD